MKKKCLKIKYYKKKIFVMLTWFIALYAMGFFLDYVPPVRKWIFNIAPALFSKIRFKIGDGGVPLLTIYSLVWTVMIGVIVFIVQHDSEPVMGLKILDILNIIFSNIELKFIIMFLAGKLWIYGMAALYEKKYILFWGLIEIFVNLYLVIRLFVSLTVEKNVQELLEENTSRSVNNTAEAEALGVSYNSRSDWMIKKAVQHINYNSEEECQALIKILVDLCRQMIMLKEENKGNTDALKDIEVQRSIVRQTNQFYDLVSIVYYTVNNDKRMNYIICECIDGMRNTDQGIYLLIRGMLSDPEFEFTTTEMENILKYLEQEEQRNVLMSLIVYTGMINKYSSAKGWSRVYLELFLKKFSETWDRNRMNWDLVKDVFLEEMERFEWNIGMTGIDLQREYNNLLKEIKLRRIQ